MTRQKELERQARRMGARFFGVADLTVAQEAIVAQGGTISHQHGVGLDHAPYLGVEKSALGMRLLRETIHTMDPEGLLNPGKLLA